MAFLLSLGSRYALDGSLPPGFPFLTFFPAVILTTLVAGLWPGIVTALLSRLAAWYFFIAPPFSFELTPGGLLALGFYVFVVGIDITVIHIMNRALEKLASERNRSADLSRQMQVMFSELQHRVSNNLQMVSGLILLQEIQVDEPVARRALEEARQRLATLGRLHRKLHDPNRKIHEMGAFLRELCGDVLDAAGAEGVVCKVSAVNAELPQEKLIPFALIVTELISNSLEHGFAQGRCGTVSIDLRPGEGGRGLVLTVEDDGAGLPDGFNLANTDSLGLKIVQTLADQISARFSMAASRGTRCMLELPTA